MDIEFFCKKCGQSVVIDAAAAGQLVDCPKCGMPLEVPYESKSFDKPAMAPSAPPVPIRTAAPVSVGLSGTLRGILTGLVVIAVIGGGFFIYNFWKNQPRDFTVDVFIRTKGGENIKCGLVEVRILGEQDITSSSSEIVKDLRVLGSEIQTNLDVAATQRTLATRKLEVAGKLAELDLQFAKDAPDFVRHGIMTDAQMNKRLNDAAESGKILKVRLAEKEAADSAYSFARAKLQEWPKSAYRIINNALPQAVTTAKTDADGRCSGKVPKPGRYAFAAYFSRTVGTDSEHTCWLVWANLEERMPKKIMLSNDNALGTDAPESVFVNCPQPHLPQD